MPATAQSNAVPTTFPEVVWAGTEQSLDQAIHAHLAVAKHQAGVTLEAYAQAQAEAGASVPSATESVDE